MSGKRWTPWEIDLLIENRTPKDIAMKTGRSVRSVQNKMYSLGIKSKSKPGVRKYTPEQRRQMVVLYLHDMTQMEVAEKIGCSQTTVCKAVSDYFKGVLSI